MPEDIGRPAGSPAAPRVRALALNTARLDDQQALKVVEQVGERLGIVCRDPIRHGADDLLQAMMSPETENMLKGERASEGI